MQQLRLYRLAILGGTLLLFILASHVSAASSWNPTLLVNTEAFQIIDDGDGSSDIELRFGQDLNARIIYDISRSRFEITKPIHVLGSITATGSVTASGALQAGSGILLNTNRSGDAVLTFGNETTDQTLRYSHSLQKFQFSKDVAVEGNLSGATLTIDGDVNLQGLSYAFPTSRGTNGTYLQEDGAGNLTWSEATLSSSGGVSLQPVYSNAVYFASGSAVVGQLTYARDLTDNENYYHWTSSLGTFNQYWIAVRVRLPETFSAWDETSPVEFRYRTGDASSAENAMRIEMQDTAGNPIALANNTGLASLTWTTATITGPEAAGTYTPGEYITVFVKIGATSVGSSDAGYINLNWDTAG